MSAVVMSIYEGQTLTATSFSITDKELLLSQQKREQARIPGWLLGYQRNNEHYLSLHLELAYLGLIFFRANVL